MSKPKVSDLKHQDMLGDAISQAKRKMVLSIWWLSVPLFLITSLVMETLYKTGTTLNSGLHQLTAHNPILPVLSLLLLPMCIMLVNALHVTKVYRILRPGRQELISMTWQNLLMIIISLIILIIYLCI
ncbi:hypothetical protein ACX0G9_25250 [Flavitalea flava]